MVRAQTYLKRFTLGTLQLVIDGLDTRSMSVVVRPRKMDGGQRTLTYLYGGTTASAHGRVSRLSSGVEAELEDLS